MTLRDEVLSRPDCADAYAAKDCHELARLLSIGRTKTVLVPLADIQAMLQSTGAWWAIKPITADQSHPAFAAAVAVTDVASARYENLDTSLPIVAQMFDALVVAGALPQVVMDEIMALGVVPDDLTQREVAVALYHDNGEPI